MTYTRDSFQQLSETYSSIVEGKVKYYKGEDRDKKTGIPKGVKSQTSKQPKEKKQTKPPYESLAASHDLQGEVVEAKVDKNYSRHIPDQRDTNELSKKRNERNAKPGENKKIDDKAFITRKPGESADSARARARAKVHKDERGVKKNRGAKPGKEKVETRARRFARAKALAKRKEFEGTIKQDSKGHHPLENKKSLSSKERLEKSFKKDSKGHHSLENQFVPDNGIVEAKCDCNCGEVPCKKCGGDHHAKEEKKLPDMRELPTRVNLVKNKLRAMGLKMSQQLTGDQLSEVARYSISELNRYEKETGKSSGRITGRSDVNTPRKGTPTKTKEKPTAVSVVKSKTIRPMTGRPQGQKKSDYADRHKEQNRKETPARTMEKRRYDPRDEVEKATDGRYSKNQRYD